ncbi:MAG TPA: hypothetical protein VF397_14950, partial [Pyrinomonadaceae bacterium]
NGGTLAIVNQPGSTKSFGYLLIKRSGSSRFSVEHPIHQPPFKPLTAPRAFRFRRPFQTKERSIHTTGFSFEADRRHHARLAISPQLGRAY